jgi:hypothetical protein
MPDRTSGFREKGFMQGISARDTRPGASWHAIPVYGPATVLALAVANGLAVRIVEASREGQATSILPGISPFELLVVLIALPLVATPAAGTEWRLGWREIATGAALLVPSSTVSWVAVAMYASLLAAGTTGARRIGAIMIAGLAVAALWSSVALKIIGGPVTGFEAAAVDWLLQLSGWPLSRTANVIGTEGGHHLVILTACTSADAIPRALLAVAALAHFAGAGNWRLVTGVAIAAGSLLFAANTVRLALMAVSSDMYAMVHGPVGANIFDAAQVGLVVAAAWIASPGAARP